MINGDDKFDNDNNQESGNVPSWSTGGEQGGISSTPSQPFSPEPSAPEPSAPPVPEPVTPTPPPAAVRPAPAPGPKSPPRPKKDRPVG